MSLTKKVPAGGSETFALGYKDRPGVVTITSSDGQVHDLLVASFKRGNVDSVVGGIGVSVQAFPMTYGAKESVTVKVLSVGTVAKDVTVHSTS